MLHLYYLRRRCKQKHIFKYSQDLRRRRYTKTQNITDKLKKDYLKKEVNSLINL
jgi:hypothetical protein